MRACMGPYDWRGFVGPKKKTSVGLSAFNSLKNMINLRYHPPLYMQAENCIVKADLYFAQREEIRGETERGGAIVLPDGRRGVRSQLQQRGLEPGILSKNLLRPPFSTT
jgi:hypothetical protein